MEPRGAAATTKVREPMATRLLIRLLTLALVVSATAVAIADEKPATKEPERRLPLRGRIAQEQEAFVIALGSLQTQFGAETDPARAQELQRQITKLKLEYEIRLYRHQLEELSTKGPTEQSARMAATISALESVLVDMGFELKSDENEDAAQ